MNKCFLKSLFFLFCEGIGTFSGFSTDFPDEVGFRGALDLPEGHILKVHDCAIKVNQTSPQQDADQVINFEEEPIGRQYQLKVENFLVFSFLNLPREDYDRIVAQADPIAEYIREKVMNSDKDIILTGYGYGADLAAWVTYNLAMFPNLFKPSQLKLIIFCAANGIAAPFNHTSKMNLLHFSRFFGRIPQEGSPCIEMPLLLGVDLKRRFNPSRLIILPIILPLLFVINYIATKKIGSKPLWRYAGYVFSTLFSLYYSVKYSVKDAPAYLTSSEVTDLFKRTVEQARFFPFLDTIGID